MQFFEKFFIFSTLIVKGFYIKGLDRGFLGENFQFLSKMSIFCILAKFWLKMKLQSTLEKRNFSDISENSFKMGDIFQGVLLVFSRISENSQYN